MQKRGQLVNKALIVIIASAIILIAFISAGREYGSQQAFYKLALAKDIALTLDLVHGIPGDIRYTYPNDVSGYDIEINDNSVSVHSHEKGKLDPVPASYGYAGTNTNINLQISGRKYLKIEKKNNILTISGVDAK